MKIYKILLIVLAFLFSVDAGMAQSGSREQRKTEKAEKKRLKEEERKENLERVLNLVEDQSFVVEAHSISGRSMNTFQVSPATNFVMVEGGQIIVQTANNFSFGYNGLGGITIKGNIRNYEILSVKKNHVRVQINFSDPVLGFSSVNLDIQENGFARAMLRDNWGRRVNFQGQFVSLENSRVFEGRPII